MSAARASRVLVAVALALSGCSKAEGGPGHVEVLLDEPHLLVTDEDGLRVVRNRAPAPEFVEVVLGAETEHIRVGSEDPAAPDFFGQVSSARFEPGRRRPDGVERSAFVIVGEGLANEVRIFRARDGRHLYTVGGHGEGPGEFVDAAPVGMDEGDRLWVWDVRRRRFTVFDPSGSLLRVVPFGEGFPLSPGVRDLSPDGSFRAHLPRLGPPRADGVRFVQDTTRVWAFDGPAGEPRLVFEDQGAVFLFEGGMSLVVPLLEGARVGYRGARVVGTDPTGLPGFRVVDDGGTSFRVEANLPARRARRSDLEAVLASGDHPEMVVEGVRAHLASVPIPEWVSPWVGVQVFADGSFAALRRGALRGGERWDVFDPGGVQLGVLALPAGATLVDLYGGFALVIERGALSGPAVVLHAVPFETSVYEGTSVPWPAPEPEREERGAEAIPPEGEATPEPLGAVALSWPSSGR